jgi:hypothetical protein
VLDAVHKVIAGYAQPLCEAVCLPKSGTYFTPSQFSLAAFKTFQTLSSHHLESVPYSTILTPEEKKVCPSFALRTALNVLVKLNLVTFPSMSNPELIQFACRAQHHAWVQNRGMTGVQESLKDSCDELGVRTPTMKSQ